MQKARELAAARKGSIKGRRFAWQLALDEQDKEWEADEKEEERKWEDETEQVRRDLEDGDTDEAWTLKRRYAPKVEGSMLPMSYDQEVTMIWEHEEVLEHVEEQVKQIVDPRIGDYYTTTEPEWEDFINQEVEAMEEEAKEADDWQPAREDVKIMLRYLNEAYAKKTTEGSDGVTPELIILASENIATALLIFRVGLVQVS